MTPSTFLGVDNALATLENSGLTCFRYEEPAQVLFTDLTTVYFDPVLSLKKSEDTEGEPCEWSHQTRLSHKDQDEY